MNTNTKVTLPSVVNLFLEFNFSKVDPYWKVRALCYFFSLDILGEKDQLIRRIEDLLFNNYLFKKNPDDALKEMADMDLESFLKNTKCAGKRSKGLSVKELEAFIKDGTSPG
jgi:hypothetical protein